MQAFDNDLTSLNLLISDVKINDTSLHCSEWPTTTFGIFQVANVFQLAAFVVPHNFQSSTLLMRSSILIGQILFMLWTIFNVCAADILSWNIALVLVNFGHTIFLLVQNWPPSIPEHMKEVYETLFKPLKVNRRQFKMLINDADVFWLEKGQLFAEEESTLADQRLTILLSGKVIVTCDNSYLHDINPNQFLDSPEWEAAENCNPDNLFQVTLIAAERSRYITWSRSKVKQLMANKPFLHAVVSCLIGKDITTKLYSLTEDQPTSNGRMRSSMDMSKINLLRNQAVIHRSRSVDTVHTGSSGFVRSDGWISHRIDVEIDPRCESALKKKAVMKHRC